MDGGPHFPTAQNMELPTVAPDFSTNIHREERKGFRLAFRELGCRENRFFFDSFHFEEQPEEKTIILEKAREADPKLSAGQTQIIGGKTWWLIN